MSQIENLVSRAEKLANAANLSLSTVSRKLLNDGKGIARLKAGGQCTLKTLETAMARLDALENDIGASASVQSPTPGRALLSASALSHLDR
ncbi:MAG: hypothetical protein RIC52_01770, partial [Amphiplicatus sp.]